jgi:stage II sporulation protein D
VLRPRDRSVLRSTLFKLDIERSEGAIVRVVARGGGNGHGVGMCQMGGLEMARRGVAAEAILAHYYPGTQVLRLY